VNLDKCAPSEESLRHWFIPMRLERTASIAILGSEVLVRSVEVLPPTYVIDVESDNIRAQFVAGMSMA
jgi:hypothetical protein